MEQTPDQQDPDPSGMPPAGEAPPPWGAVPPSGGAVPPPPVRRLYRLRNDRVVAGVASGLAAHLELDPVWVRLAFVVLAFIGGLGFLLYIVAWVVMPAADGVPVGAMRDPSARRLYRLRNDRWVAGVASGLSAYLEVDVTLVRLAFFILALFGVGIILYIAAWVLMPAIDGAPPSGWRAWHSGRGAGADLRIIAGAFFLIVAVLVLASNFDFHYSGLVWGAVLICIGLLFLVGRLLAVEIPDGGPPGAVRPRGSGRVRLSGGSDRAGVLRVPARGSRPAGVHRLLRALCALRALHVTAGLRHTRLRGAGCVVRERPPLRRPPTRDRRPGGGGAGPRCCPAPAERRGHPPHRRDGLRHRLPGAWPHPPDRGVVGAPGLVALGICLCPSPPRRCSSPSRCTGGAGNISYAPQALSAVQPAYHLAAGQLYVDLSGVDLAGQSVAVTSTVAFGHLVVVVPADTTIDLSGQVGAGEDSLLGRIDSGVRISSRFDAATGPAPAGTLTLNVSVGCGQLTVTTGAVDVQTRAGVNGHAVAVTSAVDGRRVGAR